MARFARVNLNGANIRAILRSARVQADLRRRAEAIAQNADNLLAEGSDEREDYVVHTGLTRTRARASVITASAEAIRDEAVNKSLTKSIDAGRQ